MRFGLGRGAKTDETVTLKVRDFLRLAGKVPVVVKKDRPGQLGNRLQAALAAAKPLPANPDLEKRLGL